MLRLGPFIQLGHQTLSSGGDRDRPRGAHACAGLRLERRSQSPLPQARPQRPARTRRPRPVCADFDVVYSAHISPYGAIPATLQRSPGTDVRVHVDLHDRRPDRGHLGDRAELRSASCSRTLSVRIEGGEELNEISAYISRHGCLLGRRLGGRPRGGQGRAAGLSPRSPSPRRWN